VPKMVTSRRRREIPKISWNVVLEKSGKWSYEKWSKYRVKKERHNLCTVKRRKNKWIFHIWGGNCLLIQEKIDWSVEIMWRRTRQRRQLLDDLNDTKGCPKLQEESLIWHSEDRTSWYTLITKAKMHYFSTLFWYRTLHVSDRFTVHHQESSTVYRAIGICHRTYADCRLARSGWNSEIYFGIEFYMFRTGLLSIIRSLVLYIQK
jgi:hypothetical protein